MEDRKPFDEDLISIVTLNRSEVSTGHKKTTKNTIQVAKPHNKVSPPSAKNSPHQHRNPHLENHEEKTLVSE
jgi:hypothetical protein